MNRRDFMAMFHSAELPSDGHVEEKAKRWNANDENPSIKKST